MNSHHSGFGLVEFVVPSGLVMLCFALLFGAFSLFDCVAYSCDRDRCVSRAISPVGISLSQSTVAREATTSGKNSLVLAD